MIINDPHVEGVFPLKPETDSPSLVNPDAPLSLPIAFQRFQMVGWRMPQIIHRRGGIELGQPHGRSFQDCWGKLVRFAGGKEFLGFGTGKGANHVCSVNDMFISVKGSLVNREKLTAGA
jgi:hypothetical protein